MPVVINEFEVVAETAPAPRRGGAEASAEAPPAPEVEPCAVASAMRTLEVQALRAWAH
jgi:hypothetical protein